MKSTEIIEEEVVTTMASISEMELGSEQHKAAVDAVAKLTDKVVDLKKVELEERKINMERDEKNALRAIELDKIAHEKRDQKIKNGITVASIVAPIAAAIWANVYNWRKEANGIMSSTLGRKSIEFFSKFGRK